MRPSRRSAGFLALLLVVAAALVLTGACQRASEKRAEKMIENALEKASGGKADIDLKGGKMSIKTDEGQADVSLEGDKLTVKSEDGTAELSSGGNKWPEDIPGDVPRFEGGKITATLRGSQGQGKTWTIGFDGVEEADYAKYVEALKADGWQIIVNMSAEDGAVTQARKGTTVVNATLGKSAKSLGLNVMTGVE